MKQAISSTFCLVLFFANQVTAATPLTPRRLSYDTTFGENGSVIEAAPYSTGYVLLPQVDGKVIAIATQSWALKKGWRLLAERYLANGSLDSTYGSVTDIPVKALPGPYQLDLVAAAATFLSSGKLAILLSTPTQTFLVRLESNGDPDVSFGERGILELMPSLSLRGYALVADHQNRVIVSGVLPGAIEGGSDGFVLRLDATGKVDLTFGSGGMVRLAHMNPWPNVRLFLTGGKILGSLMDWTQGHGIALFRLNSDGSVDPAFGQGGIVRHGILDFASGPTIVPTESGKIVVASVCWQYTPQIRTHFCFARFLPSGSVDSTFGNAGVVILDLPKNDRTTWVANYLVNLTVDKGGIVAVGNTIVANTLPDGGFSHSQAPPRMPTVIRLNKDGALRSFSVSSSDERNPEVKGAAFLPNGKILATGKIPDKGNPSIWMARFLR